MNSPFFGILMQHYILLYCHRKTENSLLTACAKVHSAEVDLSL